MTDMTHDVLAGPRDDRVAVEKALSIIEVIGTGRSQAMGVSWIARRASLSKSTTFRLLGVLERNGAVVRVGNDYQLGAYIQRLAQAPLPAVHEAIRERVTPHMVDLYAATHETVHLAVLDGTDVVYLNKLPGTRRSDSPSRIGGRLPAFATGVGKALLARNPKAMEIVLDTTRAPLTARSLTDDDALTRDLMTARSVGIAYDRGEAAADVHCIAAPILGRNGHPVAALSVSGPRGWFTPEQHAATLRQAAAAASRAITALMPEQSPALRTA